MAFDKTQLYSPIDCGFHDLLEHYAVLRQTVSITFHGGALTGNAITGNAITENVPAENVSAGNDSHTVDAVIIDVFARDGADWAKIRFSGCDDLELRLDQIVSINGTARPTDGNACKVS